MKTGFTPISLARYVEAHLQRNPDVERHELVGRLESAREAYLKGVRCRCGNKMWIIGSAEVGHACFTCITGEASPEGDYEIDTTESAQTFRSSELPGALSVPSSSLFVSFGCGRSVGLPAVAELIVGRLAQVHLH